MTLPQRERLKLRELPSFLMTFMFKLRWWANRHPRAVKAGIMLALGTVAFWRLMTS